MTTRLGLDVGTNSIGWCLYDGDSIRDIGVRIFSDGRDAKTGASLAVDRRAARATIATHNEAGALKERDAKSNDLDPFYRVEILL